MKSRSILILLAVAASSAAMSQARAEATGAALPIMGKSWSGGHHMGRPMTPRPGGMHMAPRPGGIHNWGPRQNGRWHAGWRAPGGWNGYQRPVRGYILPRYWISPSYYIANYSSYGLPQPAYGYGWSRYYDDAVMTDRYGRVYDSRSNISWDRNGGRYDDDGYYDDRREYRREDNGLGGAAIGAVVGGVAGNRIAGRGNRTAGTIIGAATGAVAGAIIDKAEDRGRNAPRRPGAGYDYGYGYADDNVTSNNDYDYEGRWTGTWRDQNGRTVSGEYEGRFEGNVSGGPGVDYDAPAYSGGGAHWDQGGPAGYGQGGGYVSNGWYYPAPTVTTVTITPAVTTTTTYETVSYVRKPVRHRAARKACRCK